MALTFAALIADPGSTLDWAMDLQGYNPGSAQVETYYPATRWLRTGASDTPANTSYLDGLEALQIDESMGADREIGGHFGSALVPVVIRNGRAVTKRSTCSEFLEHAGSCTIFPHGKEWVIR